jgi:hypothetical protein
MRKLEGNESRRRAKEKKEGIKRCFMYPLRALFAFAVHFSLEFGADKTGAGKDL